MGVKFVIAMMLMNLGASVSFAMEKNLPWAIIYAGASLIQFGSLLIILLA